MQSQFVFERNLFNYTRQMALQTFIYYQNNFSDIMVKIFWRNLLHFNYFKVIFLNIIVINGHLFSSFLRYHVIMKVKPRKSLIERQKYLLPTITKVQQFVHSEFSFRIVYEWQILPKIITIKKYLQVNICTLLTMKLK